MNTAKKKTINPWISVGVLVFSAMVATFNETILNVALIPIGKDMNVSMAVVQWLITGYMLITAIMVPVTAFLYQSIPTKKLYLLAMSIVLTGSIGCFASGIFPVLMVFRLIQAVGTGMMIPIMMSTTLIVAPKEKIGTAMALCVCGITLGPAFGPTISGIIIQLANWKASFILIILLVVTAMILGVCVLDNVAELTHPHLDILSVVLSTLGLASLLYGISILIRQPVIGIICMAAGIVIIAVFVYRQGKLKEPMLNFTPFKNILFTQGACMVSIAMLINFSLNVIMPSFLQGALAVSSMGSALLLLPGVLLNAASTNVSGRVLDKHGVRIMLPAGFAVFTAGLLALSGCSVTTAIPVIVIIHVIIYQGLAFTMSPAQTSALATLPRDLNAHGVAIVTTLMQIAASVGSALLGGIQSSVQESAAAHGMAANEAVSRGFTCSLYAAAVIGGIGLVFAFLFVKNQKNALKNK